jgi:hypothetical protein
MSLSPRQRPDGILKVSGFGRITAALVSATVGVAINNYSETGVRGLVFLTTIAAVFSATQWLRRFPGTPLTRYASRIALCLALVTAVAATFTGAAISGALTAIAAILTIGAILIAADMSSAVAMLTATSYMGVAIGCFGLATTMFSQSRSAVAAGCLIFGLAALVRGWAAFATSRRLKKRSIIAVPLAATIFGTILLFQGSTLPGIFCVAFGLYQGFYPLQLRLAARDLQRHEVLQRKVRELLDATSDRELLQKRMMLLYREEAHSPLPGLALGLATLTTYSATVVSLLWMAVSEKASAAIVGAVLLGHANLTELIIIFRGGSLRLSNTATASMALSVFGVFALFSESGVLGVALTFLGLAGFATIYLAMRNIGKEWLAAHFRRLTTPLPPKS